MNDGTMVAAAIKLCHDLPASSISTLAQAIRSCDVENWSYARLQILQYFPQASFQEKVDTFLATWRAESPLSAAPAADVALILTTATAAAHHYRNAQTTELVWTGPEVMGSNLRRTDQALLQVIEAARQNLMIVSFAVYKIPAISRALVRAAERGVALRICVEAPEPSGQQMAYSTIQALGTPVAQHAAIYIWPQAQRAVDPTTGRAGLLHAKCAVADEAWLYISSANLTEYALHLNIELGVLIRGGSQPGIVASHFDHLISTGVLVRVMP